MPKVLQLNGYRKQEPITKVTNPGPGKTCVLEVKQGVAICGALITLTVTGAATGGATKTIPRPSWGLNEIRCRIGNNVNGRWFPVSYHGFRGIAAINSKEMAGTVQYFQGGNAITVALNGYTYGNEPVRIDSPEDVALQGAIANNTATVAIFTLPIMFSEDWRKDPDFAGEAMALLTGFDDGKGGLGALLATTITFELDQPTAPGTANSPATQANTSAIGIAASLIYTNTLAAKGSTVQLSKHKVHNKAYTNNATGVDLGDVFDLNGVLQRFSLLTAADKITRVQVFQGATLIRDVTFAENQNALRTAQCNGDASIANRFDIELDLNDDPTTALRLTGMRDLKVIAYFASAGDVPPNCTILADYYGPVE
jgi:hypothetical protein